MMANQLLLKRRERYTDERLHPPAHFLPESFLPVAHSGDGALGQEFLGLAKFPGELMVVSYYRRPFARHLRDFGRIQADGAQALDLELLHYQHRHLVRC